MTLPPGLHTAGFVALCILIPILWGWFVNWLFLHWGRRRPAARRRGKSKRADEESKFIDYQI